MEGADCVAAGVPLGLVVIAAWQAANSTAAMSGSLRTCRGQRRAL
jgi:hypothetical protein